MALRFRQLLCDRIVSCCCLPARVTVSMMSLLGIVFSGIFSIVLWLEVAYTPGMTGTERAGFVFAGIVVTILLAASAFGLIGAIIPKQLFIQIYAYFGSVHLTLNIAASAYLLSMVTHFPVIVTGSACQEIVRNVRNTDQCIISLKIAKWVYFVLTIILLLIELYGVLVAGQYVSQLKSNKRNAQRSRVVNQEAMKLVYPGKEAQTTRSLGLTFPRYLTQVYNPYEEITRSNLEVDPSTTYRHDPALSAEGGYGGGLWTHQEISQEEKAQLEEREEEMMLPEIALVNGEEMDKGHEKFPMGPPHQSSEDLPAPPVYARRDPPWNG